MWSATERATGSRGVGGEGDWRWGPRCHAQVPSMVTLRSRLIFLSQARTHNLAERR